MNDNYINKTIYSRGSRWYQHWWGILLLAIGIGLIAVVAMLAFITIKYWWQIKSGLSPNLPQKSYNGFSGVKNEPKLTGNPTKRAEIETASSPFLGNSSASVVIVEFEDFKCPNSQKASSIMSQVVAKYGNKIKFISRNFPVESLYPGSNQLAKAAYCAGQQGKYWEARAMFYDNNSTYGPLTSLSTTSLKNISDYLSLEANSFSTCFNSSQTSIAINRDYADGYRFGIKGTPTFFVNGTKIEGVVTLSMWEKYLENVK